MAINATSEGVKRELIPAGNYIARCYQMIEIGTVEEEYKGDKKTMKKVRIGWELPTELRVFKEENGEQPLVISQEYTLSLGEKANLRKMLASWRGKDFTEEQAKVFDITNLLGVSCMLNIIHKPSADGKKTNQSIAGVSPLAKGVTCPDQINENFLFEFDNFDPSVLEKLPDFIKLKIKSSEEYKKICEPQASHMDNGNNSSDISNDDLPF